MTDPRAITLIHQAFFGWRYNQPTGKLDLVASSLEERDIKRWLARLKEHIRLQGADQPSHALSYIAFEDDMVAILRRVDLGYSDGRNNSHALIGPASILTVTVALALDDWTHWKKDPPQNYWMSTMTASNLPDVTDDELTGQMRPLATRCEQAVGTVLGRLLDKPRLPLSIIGCPLELRLPMVWALRAAGHDYLLRNLSVTRRWSFSTHEARHEDAVSRLPEIVFLPSRPDGTGVANRTIVDLTADREPASANAATATRLVAQLLHDVKSRQPEPVYEMVQVPAQPPVRETYSPVQQPVALHNARTVEEFVAALEKLEASVSGPQRRKELRDTLDVDTMNKITNFAENAPRKQLTQRVLTLFYGPQLSDLQLNDGLTHASDQIKKCDSDYVARTLCAGAPPKGKTIVSAAAYHRWLAFDRPPVITPQPRNTPDQRPPVDKHVARAVVLRMVGAFAAVFLIGFLVGLLIAWPSEPAADGKPDAEATTSTAAPQAGAPGPKSATLPTVGRVNLNPADRQQVYSFVLLGGKYYPQAPCQQVEGNDWQCVRPSAPSAPGEPSLMAIVVPTGEVAELQNLALQQKAVDLRASWTDRRIIERG